MSSSYAPPVRSPLSASCSRSLVSDGKQVIRFFVLFVLCFWISFPFHHSRTYDSFTFVREWGREQSLGDRVMLSAKGRVREGRRRIDGDASAGKAMNRDDPLILPSFRHRSPLLAPDRISLAASLSHAAADASLILLVPEFGARKRIQTPVFSVCSSV